MKIFLFLACTLCIALSLSPKTKHKRNTYYTSNSNNQKSPYEQEKDTLKAALFCNDDEMKVGDVCYCGRIKISCCESKDKCTGTLTRTCSKTVDDFKCDTQVTQGMTYWQEMKNIKDKMECSNEHYDKNSPCLCGKIMVSCCKSKSHCDVGLLSETCDSKATDKTCSDIKKSLTNLTEPKYYREYLPVFSSSEKIYALSAAIMSIIFIIL